MASGKMQATVSPPGSAAAGIREQPGSDTTGITPAWGFHREAMGNLDTGWRAIACAVGHVWTAAKFQMGAPWGTTVHLLFSPAHAASKATAASSTLRGRRPLLGCSLSNLRAYPISSQPSGWWVHPCVELVSRQVLIWFNHPGSLGTIPNVKLPPELGPALYLLPCEMGSIAFCYAKGSPIGGLQVFQSSDSCLLGGLPRRVSKEEAGPQGLRETHLPMLQGAPLRTRPSCPWRPDPWGCA